MKEFLAEKGVKPSKGISCPMPKAKDLYDDSPLLDEEAAKEYRSSVGTLNFFAQATRYDIAHAMSRLGQHMAKPTEASSKALQKVLKYLGANLELQLEGTRPLVDTYKFYSDSDHAGG